MAQPLVVVSNRGPVTHRHGTDGSLASVDFSKFLSGDILFALAMFGVLALVPVAIKHVLGRAAKRRDG